MKLIQHRAGYKIYINPKEKAGVSVQLAKKGSYENKEIRMSLRYLKKGDVVFDIGANIGVHTLHYSTAVGEEGQVYSFEPSEENYTYLLRNIEVNGCLNVRPQNMGLAEKSGEGVLYLCEDNLGDNRTYPVPDRKIQKTRLITVDEFVAKNSHKVDFIKMDTQGSEFNIFKGATETLKTNPILFFEFWPKGLMENDCDPNEMLNFLIDRGYTLYSRMVLFDTNRKFGKDFPWLNLFGFPKK